MIETKNLTRSFKNGDVLTPVLKGIDFAAADGEFVAIMGRSGAGKSTFLYQISLLDEPTGGAITIDGHDTHRMSEEQRMRFRLNKFGYVFQDYALLPELTALENVALPLLMQGKTRRAAYAEAQQSLERVELGHRLHNLPSQLSGGEQQMLAFARGLMTDPKILLLDEPSLGLAPKIVKEVFAKIKEINEKHKTAIIVVEHNIKSLLKIAGRAYVLDKGKVVAEDLSHKLINSDILEKVFMGTLS